MRGRVSCAERRGSGDVRGERQGGVLHGAGAVRQRRRHVRRRHVQGHEQEVRDGHVPGERQGGVLFCNSTHKNTFPDTNNYAYAGANWDAYKDPHRNAHTYANRIPYTVAYASAYVTSYCRSQRVSLAEPLGRPN